MSVLTATQLLTFLQEHEFLTPSQVQQLEESSLTKSTDAGALARELVDRNWLTAYQVNALLQGRGAELVLGPYRILDWLGQGGMGQVFKARHASMDRVVALKIIPKDVVSNPIAVGRFYREVRAVAQLSHPNIVTAFEVNQAGQTHYLAMELVDGIDLARLVQQSGRLPIPRACEYIRQAAAGLQHAHEKGLVHRDIKPGNLMVARPRADEPSVIKILDFGLARFESESEHPLRLTQLGKIVGTVDYMAPEQAQNARTADIRADIYSLGCSLFYLLTGTPPFSGEDTVERIGTRVLGDAPSVRQCRPEVSPALERVLGKMMARNPLDRYQTPSEVAQALEPHTRDERRAQSRTPPISDRLGVHASKRRTAAKASVQPFTPPPAAFPSLQSDSERERRQRVIAPLWIALAGAVALLGILVGVIVLVANSGASDSKKGPALASTDTRVDKTDRDIPGEKPLRPKDPVGEIRLIGRHSGGAMSVAFAPNGRTAVSGGHDKTVRLWDVESGREIHRFEGHTDLITGVCFTPDGLHILSWSDDKTLRVWEVASGKQVRRFEHGAQVDHQGVMVTPAGERILSASDDKIFHVWELGSGKELSRFGFQGDVKHNVWVSAISTDGRRALSSGGDNILRLWDVEKGTQMRVLDTQSSGGIFSPDGRFALAYARDGYLRLYDVGSGKLIRRFEQGPAGVTIASFSPDGERVLASYEHPKNGGLDYFELWDVPSGREIHRLAGNPGGASKIIFSPDGRRALSAGRDGTVRLWGLPD
jgi:serine/threonine protein kinase